LDLKIDGVADVIEKCFETGVADVIEKCFETGVSVSFGGLFVSFGESGQKRQDLIWSDGFYFPFAKFVCKAGEKKLIIFQRIFFSN
jgi:hypothetical protein